MLYYFVQMSDGTFTIRDGDGNTVALAYVEADAREIVAALNLIERMRRDFPGMEDGETEVSGADLIDAVCDWIKFGDDGRYYDRRVSRA